MISSEKEIKNRLNTAKHCPKCGSTNIKIIKHSKKSKRIEKYHDTVLKETVEIECNDCGYSVKETGLVVSNRLDKTREIWETDDNDLYNKAMNKWDAN